MNENFICLEMICPMCGDTHYVTVLNDDFKNWRAGELIQKAMPYLEPYEREQLISHICPECQEQLFGDKQVGANRLRFFCAILLLTSEGKYAIIERPEGSR